MPRVHIGHTAATSLALPRHLVFQGDPWLTGTGAQDEHSELGCQRKTEAGQEQTEMKQKACGEVHYFNLGMKEGAANGSKRPCCSQCRPGVPVRRPVFQHENQLIVLRITIRLLCGIARWLHSVFLSTWCIFLCLNICLNLLKFSLLPH